MIDVDLLREAIDEIVLSDVPEELVEKVIRRYEVLYFEKSSDINLKIPPATS